MNFNDDMGPEARKKIEELFAVKAIDERTALLEQFAFTQKEMGDIARLAKQPVSVELNEIGDRKTVGDIVYELTELGWNRLPIGTVE